jgi:hypothetical protein
VNIYTAKTAKAMNKLWREHNAKRIAHQAAHIWDDLPPTQKGEMLLAKWQEEDEDFDPAIHRLDDDCYCPGCGNLVTCCECG